MVVYSEKMMTLDGGIRPVTFSDPGRGLLIHELIAKQAESAPHTIAVRSGSIEIDYKALLARSSQLAHHLRNCGVDTGSLVLICLDRSVDTVVGILATLLAGGTYVPVDPGYPRERIFSIIEDANAKFAVTKTSHLNLLPAGRIRAICMDAEWQSISSLPVVAPDNFVTPDDPAYIIYTSGSTGKPKGVIVPHESLRNFVRISQSVLDVSPGDVYLQSASVAYAVSVRQIMTSLVNGAILVIASDEQVRDPVLLFEEIKRSGVTLMDVVPSFWRSVIKRLQDLPSSERCNLLDNRLRRIVSVGEALPYDIPRDWLKFGGGQVELVNIFGQSETTGIVSAYPIPSPLNDNLEGTVPIGRSIAETRLYILDQALRPVKPGDPGELCISNPCLAGGYLHLPELTALKFNPNPFEDGFGNRLYRTGDLARQLEDGTIEFLGRSDAQVKIRGQRLDLGEVESVIRRIQEIGDCVVLPVGDELESRYLTAYIVWRGRQLDKSDLQRFLRLKLPDYMIPARFVYLDSLPSMPNGKVDRQALLESSVMTEVDQDRKIEFPRDQVEERLIAIWRELMPEKKIGTNDDFFEIGGQSLMAVRMFSRIEKEFGVRLPLTTLLRDSTISRLAEVLRNQKAHSRQEPVVVAMNSSGNKPPVFGVHGHEGGVLFWRNIVRRLPADQPFYALQAPGVDGLSRPLQSIEEMASLYLGEMRKIQPYGPYFLSGFSMGGEIAFEIGQQLFKNGEQVALLIMLDTRNPKRRVRHEQLANIAESMGTSTGQGILGNAIRLRMAWHSSRLSSLNFSGKIEYLWILIKTRFKRAVLFILADSFHKRRKRLPDRLLMMYLRTLHSKLLHQYVPHQYPGRITLFRSSETARSDSDDSPWSWKALAEGGFEIHRFDATHNIVDDEYAEAVARKLNECLVGAQGG